MIGLLAFDGNYPSLRDAETYKEIESEIGKARKFRVSELTVTIKSSENQNANLRLVAYG